MLIFHSFLEKWKRMCGKGKTRYIYCGYGQFDGLSSAEKVD